MDNSEWFVRFKKELHNKEKEIKLSKDNDSIETRYAILKEEANCYYISRNPNSFSKNGVIKIDKQKEGILFDVYLEVI